MNTNQMGNNFSVGELANIIQGNASLGKIRVKTVSNGHIQTAELYERGVGYVASATPCDLSPVGVGFTADITTTAGAITGAAINTAGTGYVAGQTLLVIPTNYVGGMAYGCLVVDTISYGGEVTAISVQGGSSGTDYEDATGMATIGGYSAQLYIDSVGNSSFNITNVYGAYHQVKTGSGYSGFITNADALHIAGPDIYAGGSVLNSRGLRIAEQNVSGVGGLIYVGTNVVNGGTGYAIGDKLHVIQTGATGGRVKVLTAGGGVVYSVSPYGGILECNINNGGTGYNVGDVATVILAGASGGEVRVEATTLAGVVTKISVRAPGDEYYQASILSTTVSPTGGTGLTVQITHVSGEGSGYYDGPATTAKITGSGDNACTLSVVTQGEAYSIYQEGAEDVNFFAGIVKVTNPKVNIAHLPISATGLETGDLWCDTTGGLNIVKVK